MKEKAFLKKTDIIIILAILAAAAVLYLVINRVNPDLPVGAKVYYDSKEIKQVDLTQDGPFVLEGHENVTFEVREGAVAFVHSDCPDKVCVKTGFITRPSQTAVCLPNKLMLRLYYLQPTDDFSDEADMVAG